MENRELERAAQIYKALGDCNRLHIMGMLSGGEMCACRILETLDVTQPTLSHHMKILCEAELVTGTRDGKWMHYTVTERGKAYSEGAARLLKKKKMAEKEEQKMERDNKTKLYILTGFLGSGKTTVLTKLISRLSGKKIGIIQNELGKISIDGEILKNDKIEMTELNGGSIFCKCRKLNFVQALAEMSAQNFEYLFVESSGFGDPSNVEEILGAARELCGEAYDFSGTICLVDAVNFLDQLEDEETVNRQMKHCHMSVLTKVDLVDAERVVELKEAIRRINPVCPIRISSFGELDLRFLEEDLMQYQWAESEDTTNSEVTKPKTLTLSCEQPVNKAEFEQFLTVLEPDAYRIKGFFELENEGWQQVDVVGTRVDYQKCEKQEKSKLVIISKIGAAIIKPIFDAWEEKLGVPMQLKN